MEQIIPFDKLAMEVNKQLPDAIVREVNRQLVVAANEGGTGLDNFNVVFSYHNANKCKDGFIPVKYRLSIFKAMSEAGYKYVNERNMAFAPVVRDAFKLPLAVRIPEPEVENDKHSDTK